MPNAYRKDELEIETFLRENGLATSGTGLQKIARALAVLTRRHRKEQPTTTDAGTYDHIPGPE